MDDDNQTPKKRSSVSGKNIQQETHNSYGQNESVEMEKHHSLENGKNTAALVNDTFVQKENKNKPLVRKLFHQESIWSNNTTQNTRPPLACLDTNTYASWNGDNRGNFFVRKKH
jgi:hypothetical protein